MAPTLRGPGGAGSREDEDEEDAADRRRRRSLDSATASTSTPPPPPPPPPHQDIRDDQPSLFSVALSGGDVVLVDKFAARAQRYKRGDVVLLR